MVQNIIFIAILTCFSAFFSSSETALFSLNKLRLEKLAEEGKKTAKVAKYLTDHDKITLSGLLIGNNVVNIAASSLMTVLVLELMPKNAALAGTVATLTITVLILIFAEIAPKIIAKKKALSWACVVAYPMFAISMVLFLFVGRDISAFLPRFLLHLALLPVVAGVSYEVLKGLAHSDNWFTRIARWPGLQMQRLTTKEPDMKMLEVAIVSINVALHGMPKNAPLTEEGWAILTDYKQSEEGYEFPVEAEA